jgi:hypothetical protein
MNSCFLIRSTKSVTYSDFVFSFFLFFFLDCTGVWTKAVALPLEPYLHPFHFGYFWGRISHLCLGWPGPQSYPLIYVSHVAGMGSAHLHAKLFIGWDEGLMNFFPRLASKHDPLEPLDPLEKLGLQAWATTPGFYLFL